MYKNKSISGRNNICGIKIRELRSRMNDVSQKRLADMLQLLGLDLIRTRSRGLRAERGL